MKRINAGLLSKRYHVRSLDGNDVKDVVSLCAENELYYRHCPPFVSEKSVLKDMSALPPGKELRDKYYVGYFDRDALIAVLDLICGYPDDDTCFIGFFMLAKRLQGAGVGSAVVSELCGRIKELGFARVRLGWIRGNPQASHFWKKNGFCETGASYDTDGYTVIVAEKRL